MIIFKCKSSNSKSRSQNIEIQSQSQQILCKTPSEEIQMSNAKILIQIDRIHISNPKNRIPKVPPKCDGYSCQIQNHSKEYH